MKNNIIFQTSTINALENKVYNGDKDQNELKKYGSFGLGTIDEVNGELIIFDNEFYVANVECQVQKVKKQSKMPFVTIANVDNKYEKIKLPKILNFKQLSKFLVDKYHLKNYPAMFVIKAKFDYLKIRSESCQTKPYQNLCQSLKKLEKIHEFQNIRGIFVSTWYPQHLNNLNVHGFHHHFVSDDKKIGGHVYDFLIDSHVELKFEQYTDLHLGLINSIEYETADIKSSTSSIKKIEK